MFLCYFTSNKVKHAVWRDKNMYLNQDILSNTLTFGLKEDWERCVCADILVRYHFTIYFVSWLLLFKCCSKVVSRGIHFIFLYLIIEFFFRCHFPYFYLVMRTYEEINDRVSNCDRQRWCLACYPRLCNSLYKLPFKWGNEREITLN